MGTTYKASLDTVSKIITSLVAPIFTIFPIYYYYMFSHGSDLKYELAFVGLIAVLLSAFVLCLVNWPKAYALENNQLIIKNLVGTKSYLITDFKEVKAMTKKEIGLVLRIFGNGGVFGYTGWFTARTLGRMRWFVTNTDKMVIITLSNGKNIAVSPDETNAFVEYLKRLIV